MAIIKTESISQANIKTRWEEPYVSSAINRQMSAIPRGVYRGFKVTQMATPGAGITITSDTYDDSLLLHEDLINGYKTAVRLSADTDILFTVTSGVTYYLWVDVSYQVSSATVGNFKVGEAADLAADPNAIPVASILVPSGTTVLDANITQSPTASPVSFLQPVPSATQKNYWGMLDQTRFDRLPTQNQKDAMDNASAPTGANPFATVADQPTDIPFTYVVSDGVRSVGGDFNGTTGLQDAMDALETAGIPGDIYVRRGDYTLTASKTYTVPIRIICEGHHGQAQGLRCLLSTGAYTLAFSAPVFIYSLEISGTLGTTALSVGHEHNLEWVEVSIGRTVFNAAMSGGRCINCFFHGRTTLNGTFFSPLFDSCQFFAEEDDYCVSIEGDVSLLRFYSCVMDGTNTLAGGPARDGGGIYMQVGSGVSWLTIDGLIIWSQGAYYAMNLQGTNSLKRAEIRNVHVLVGSQWGSVVSSHIVNIVGKNNCYVTIDGFGVEITHGDPIDSGLFSFAYYGTPSDNIRTIGDIRNVIIRGDGNVVQNSTSSNAGVVTIRTQGNVSYSTVMVRGMVVSGFRGNQSASASAYLVVAEPGGSGGGGPRIVFDGLVINTLDGTAITGTAYFAAFVTAFGDGTVVLENSTIDGGDLNVGAFDGQYIGVWMPVAGSVAEPGGLIIRNSLIYNWNQNDVRSDNANCRLTIDGMRHRGTSTAMKDGSAGARIHLLANWIQIVNCWYDDNSSGLSTPYWCFISSASLAHAVFASNIVRLPAATDEVVYVPNLFSSGKYTFIGNIGVGRINVQNTDNHIGIGDGDSNTNDLSVNLR